MSSTRRPLTIASGRRCEQALEAILDRVRDARVLGARDDRRQRAVEVEREQRARRDDGGQRGLAVGREQVLHVNSIRWRCTRASMRSRRRQRPASDSMRPAQR